jgi:hypothetical protein
VTSYTVTATATNNTFTGGLLRVYVLDNAALAGTPATATSTTAYNCSITTTTAGSFVYGTANNESASTSFTASASTTLTDNVTINAGGAQGCSFHTTSGTGTPGATTVGSSTTFATNYGVVALEVLASGGTQSIDASGPAVVSSTTLTSFTTASFTPPGGTLLVAVFTACGNGSANVCVGSVSASPALTWTEQVKISSTVGAANSYSGVWTAAVPASVTVTPPSWAQRVAVVPFTADVLM